MQPRPEDATPIADRTLTNLVRAIAAKSPAPGGGAVVAAAGALASALGGMVVAYSSGKKSTSDHAAAAATLERAARTLLDLADEDARAYAELNRLQRLDEGDPEREGLARAALMATGVPVYVAVQCLYALEALESLVGTSNRWLRSDLAIAAVLLEATLRSAWWNVHINVPVMREAGVQQADIDRQLESASIDETLLARFAAIEHACREDW